jgi:hypothetical protein
VKIHEESVRIALTLPVFESDIHGIQAQNSYITPECLVLRKIETYYFHNRLPVDTVEELLKPPTPLKSYRLHFSIDSHDEVIVVKIIWNGDMGVL